jgi:nicotinamidase-related amidase
VNELPLRTVHLCIDMQRLFGPGGPWATPWMPRVLPIVTEIAARKPEQTVFTRFIPPQRADEMPGMWRRYYEKWRDVTRENLDPSLLELIEPLDRFAPPAAVIDKTRYSAFAGTES